MNCSILVIESVLKFDIIIYDINFIYNITAFVIMEISNLRRNFNGK